MDIWPLMTGTQDSLYHDLVLYFDSWNLQCARMGQWKLHVSRYNTYAWSPDPPGGRLNLPLVNPELYDLQNDPGESYDTADLNQQVVVNMKQRINQLLNGFPPQVQSAWNATLKRKVEGTWPGELPILQS
jgi:hypothetical protein